MATSTTAYISCICLLIYSGLAASQDGNAGSGGDSGKGSGGDSGKGSGGDSGKGSGGDSGKGSGGDSGKGSGRDAGKGSAGDTSGGYTRVLVYGNLTCPHDPIIRAEVWIRQHMAGKYHSIRQYFSDFPPMPRNLLGQAMLKKSQESLFLRIQPTDGMSPECQAYIRGRINVTQLRHSSLPNTMTYNVGTCDLSNSVGICSNFLSENVEMPTNPQFIGQRITLAGELICPGGHGHMKAQLLLKSQKHGKVIAIADYPGAKPPKTSVTRNKDPFQQEGGSPTILTTGRTEPSSVYLTMTPMEPTKPECSKTIEGTIPMSDFNPPNGPSISFDLGTCDFAIGECSNFARGSHGVKGNSLVIRGSIVCPNSTRVEAVAVLKRRPNSPNAIKSQIYSNKAHPSTKKNITDDSKSGESGKDGIILEADTNEPMMVFLDITPVKMPSRCRKPIRGKIGMRAFSNAGGKEKVFDTAAAPKMSSVFVARTERTASLFARITGLLRTGQMKWEDRPLWYDVYVAFPPAHEPVWDIKMPKREEPVPKIFYEEDTALARFYQEFDAPSVIDLSGEKTDSICGHFLKQYRSTREACPELSPDALFSHVISELKISREAPNTRKKQ